MLHRSLLYVPGDTEKMLLKINELKADLIIIDLEDAVAEGNKESARDLIKTHISTFDKNIVIRINDIHSKEYLKDIKFINDISFVDNFKGIVLPKAETERDVNNLAAHLKLMEKTIDSDKYFSIIPIIESALGVENSLEIAKSSNRIQSIAFGGVDYVTDIDGVATHDETELLYARSKVVTSSRIAEKQKPIDTVYVDIKNKEGFRKVAEFVKSLGFGGKLLIHPNQTEVANEVFSPNDEEIKDAKEIINNVNDQGVFLLNGKMVDKPIIDKAKRVIKDYQLITEFEGRESGKVK